LGQTAVQVQTAAASEHFWKGLRRHKLGRSRVLDTSSVVMGMALTHS
jgi:hypothetical protein